MEFGKNEEKQIMYYVKCNILPCCLWTVYPFQKLSYFQLLLHFGYLRKGEGEVADHLVMLWKGCSQTNLEEEDR